MKKWMSLAGFPLMVSSALAEETQEHVRRSIFAVQGEHLLVVAIIALIIAVVTVITMRAQLRTAEHKTDAADYVREGSFNLQVRQDQYLYQTVERRKIEKQEKKEEEA